MNEKTKTLSLPLTNTTATVAFVGISLLSLIVPFFLGSPQWLVGTIVNACLFLAAIFLPKKFFTPLIILPSLGVLARGIIFGPFTSFLIYFLPFIWLGNLILVLVFKNLVSGKNLDSRFAQIKILKEKSSAFKYFFFVFCASAAKFIFLMAIANLYFKFNFVPAIFLQTMGIIQLLTAMAGGVIAWFIFNIYGEFNAKNQRIT